MKNGIGGAILQQTGGEGGDLHQLPEQRATAGMVDLDIYGVANDVAMGAVVCEDDGLVGVGATFPMGYVALAWTFHEHGVNGARLSLIELT